LITNGLLTTRSVQWQGCTQITTEIKPNVERLSKQKVRSNISLMTDFC